MDLIIDLHCHPSMKPFGHSFKADNQQQNARPASPACAWHRDRPTLFDKVLNFVAQLTKFRQSDFTSSRAGRVRVVVAALYPPERGFFVNKLGTGPVGDVALDLATGLGHQRIQAIQQQQDYFLDLLAEYEFLRGLDGRTATLPSGEKACYRLCGSRAAVETALQEPGTLAVLLSIEGAHAFGCGLDPAGRPAQLPTLQANIRQVKAWPHCPLFITFAHHFYNELGGHATSLTGIVAKFTDQTLGLGAGLTELGRAVLRELLDPTTGRRILIDVKHMSRLARQHYYALLDAEYADQNIPVVASHGAVAGNAADRHLFWDFDIRWAGSMHDANLWGRTAIGQFCKAAKLSPYALVGDAAYPCRPWMLAPFKGHKDGMSRDEYHWNFVQSSTRMCIERAFGMLKGRWRILLKRVDMQLKNVPEMVSACLVLHNICIIFGDSFWRTEWVQEATDVGARVLAGGNVLDAAHHIYAPTLLTDTTADMKVCTEEAFGPIAILESVPDFETAIARVNGSRFGLQAGIFTNRVDRMKLAHERLEVGGIIIGGVPGFRVDSMPYGGIKDSGLGREGVRYAMEEMTEPRLLVY
ncbi:MAG: aldehyde dehydrogenase family protein [Hymenobacter sp.]|nr:aldehyde dehydrogenase family protein [Hymenobacter sp.]